MKKTAFMLSLLAAAGMLLQACGHQKQYSGEQAGSFASAADNRSKADFSQQLPASGGEEAPTFAVGAERLSEEGSSLPPQQETTANESTANESAEVAAAKEMDAKEMEVIETEAKDPSNAREPSQQKANDSNKAGTDKEKVSTNNNSNSNPNSNSKTNSNTSEIATNGPSNSETSAAAGKPSINMASGEAEKKADKQAADSSNKKAEASAKTTHSPTAAADKKTGPQPIGWSEFFDGEDQTTPSERFWDLSGSTVTIKGFMGEVLSFEKNWFLLIPEPGAECPFDNGDETYWNKIMIVFVPDDVKLRYKPEPLQITGRLDVGIKIDESGYKTMFRLYDASFKEIKS